MTMETLIEKKNLIGTVLQFRGLAYYHHGGKRSGIETNMAGEVTESSVSVTGSRRRSMRHKAWLERLRLQIMPCLF